VAFFGSKQITSDQDAQGEVMFRGLYEHTIDAKGRTSLPARFREALARSAAQADAETEQGERLILTTGIDQCLVAYAPSEWRAFEARLSGLPQFDPAIVQLKRLYVAGATECEIDKHGRLLIPPMLREYAELKREVVWAGMATTIELWDRERWNAQVSLVRADRQAMARALGDLGL
jgi:MraZ protein